MTSMQDETNPNLIPPLVLAYVGDAVFELFIRSRLVKESEYSKVKELHKAAVKFVQAERQAEIIHHLDSFLTDKERDIVRRGRNAKGGGPRRGNIVEYRHSTGFEALLGYLYLDGQQERLTEILEQIHPHMDAK